MAGKLIDFAPFLSKQEHEKLGDIANLGLGRWCRGRPGSHWHFLSQLILRSDPERPPFAVEFSTWIDLADEFAMPTRTMRKATAALQSDGVITITTFSQKWKIVTIRPECVAELLAEGQPDWDELQEANTY